VTAPTDPSPPELPDDLPSLTVAACELRGGRVGPGVVSGAELGGADAHDLRLAEVRLDNVDLAGCVAPGAQLVDVVVHDGSWANARLHEATLGRVAASGVRATGLDLTESTLSDLVFTDCRLDLALFRFARLERVAFVDCRLGEADFHGATIASARFERCSLARATFAAATLGSTEIRACDLTELDDVDRLRGVRMPWPDVVQIAGLLASAAGIEVVDG
jgi:uncharacterized protein YjbI with pentapeptide repeats